MGTVFSMTFFGNVILTGDVVSADTTDTDPEFIITIKRNNISIVAIITIQLEICIKFTFYGSSIPVYTFNIIDAIIYLKNLIGI